ncbi:MAG: hypothetical protein ACT4PO_03230 [Actinomycetota bacterium]
MRKASGFGGTVFAVAAVAACCALPLVALTAGGALAAAGGLAARYWPLTALGVAVAVWAGVRLGRFIRARNRVLRGDDFSEH